MNPAVSFFLLSHTFYCHFQPCFRQYSSRYRTPFWFLYSVHVMALCSTRDSTIILQILNIVDFDIIIISWYRPALFFVASTATEISLHWDEPKVITLSEYFKEAMGMIFCASILFVLPYQDGRIDYYTKCTSHRGCYVTLYVIEETWSVSCQCL